MTSELSLLREQLCRDANEYCRECFAGSPCAANQNPPNVFRVGRNTHASLFFIFDKPNNNDGLRPELVPIAIFDPRPFGHQPTHSNLCHLLEDLGFSSADSTADPLDSDLVHVTNAVKCDKCAVTGRSGRVAIGETQATTCRSRFLLRELAIIKPVALVFFGEFPQRYVLGKSTPLWKLSQVSLAGVTYWVMRVPHTSPTAFNTHGGQGEKYKLPFQDLRARVTSA